ncbi:hypothetical protein DFH06DRAFT_1146571 [Mycena polygramma]|nr:hypothetical protein DFH06DRAFT_1146571 [Mycena polygramma]
MDAVFMWLAQATHCVPAREVKTLFEHEDGVVELRKSGGPLLLGALETSAACSQRRFCTLSTAVLLSRVRSFHTIYTRERYRLHPPTTSAVIQNRFSIYLSVLCDFPGLRVQILARCESVTYLAERCGLSYSIFGPLNVNEVLCGFPAFRGFTVQMCCRGRCYFVNWLRFARAQTRTCVLVCFSFFKSTRFESRWVSANH